jgi:hypothetical protein
VPRSAALDSLPLAIYKESMVQPHPSGSIGIRSISKLKVSLHPGDETSMTRKFYVLASEILHAIIDFAPWNCEWAVLDPDTLGTIVIEELWFKLYNRGVGRRVFGYVSEKRFRAGRDCEVSHLAGYDVVKTVYKEGGPLL